MQGNDVGGGVGAEFERADELRADTAAPGQGRAAADVDSQRAGAGREPAAVGGPLEGRAAGAEGAAECCGAVALIDAAVELNEAVVVDAGGRRGARADRGLQRAATDFRHARVGVGSGEQELAVAGLGESRCGSAAGKGTGHFGVVQSGSGVVVDLNDAGSAVEIDVVLELR